MDLTKIRLSEEEMELACNTNWILTKNEILYKATLLLSNLQQLQQHWISNQPLSTPVVWQQCAAKIAKGENYNGLPYRLLDFPAFFEKNDILAMRTMFWWGNFFSITLHLAGKYKINYQQKIITALPDFKEEGFYICTNEEQWDHHFQENNYLPTSAFTNNQLVEMIVSKDFLKISAKISVTKWDDATTILLQKFKCIVEKIAG